MILKWLCSCGSYNSIGKWKCMICGKWKGTK